MHRIERSTSSRDLTDIRSSKFQSFNLELCNLDGELALVQHFMQSCPEADHIVPIASSGSVIRLVKVLESRWWLTRTGAKLRARNIVILLVHQEEHRATSAD